MLTTGRITRHRIGDVVDLEDGELDVDDQRTFEFLGFGQDWIIELSARNMLKWGFDVIRQDATYDYLSVTTLRDPDSPTEPLPPITTVDIDLEPEGTSYSAYVADRLQISGPLVIELGLRWDRQTWIGDHQLSPRFNLRLALDADTILRAAWGIFYQCQRLNELQVEDGVDEFFPAQRADHWLLGVEHSFTPGLAGRLEIFRKDLSNLRPRYENLFNPIQLFPNPKPDRVRRPRPRVGARDRSDIQRQPRAFVVLVGQLRPVARRGRIRRRLAAAELGPAARAHPGLNMELGRVIGR